MASQQNYCGVGTCQDVANMQGGLWVKMCSLQSFNRSNSSMITHVVKCVGVRQPRSEGECYKV